MVPSHWPTICSFYLAKYYFMLWEDWCKWISLPAGWHVWSIVHASSGKTGVDGWLHWSQRSQTGTSWRGKFAIVFVSVWEKSPSCFFNRKMHSSFSFKPYFYSSLYYQELHCFLLHMKFASIVSTVCVFNTQIM